MTGDPREPVICPRCGATCRFDGWDHVHPDGVGIGSCLDDDVMFDRTPMSVKRLRARLGATTNG